MNALDKICIHWPRGWNGIFVVFVFTLWKRKFIVSCHGCVKYDGIFQSYNWPNLHALIIGKPILHRLQEIKSKWTRCMEQERVNCRLSRRVYELSDSECKTIVYKFPVDWTAQPDLSEFGGCMSVHCAFVCIHFCVAVLEKAIKSYVRSMDFFLFVLKSLNAHRSLIYSGYRTVGYTHIILFLLLLLLFVFLFLIFVGFFQFSCNFSGTHTHLSRLSIREFDAHR